ncbi:MAG: N-acetylmuramoyl-L-alanine amidase, partial [Pseudomonadota bacterium]
AMLNAFNKWNFDMFSKAATPDSRLARYDHLIVHVTASPPSADWDDKDVRRIHVNGNGWSRCGYHAIIKRDGTWLDSDNGAVTAKIGASGIHVGGCGRGWNGRSFGVSMVGGVDASGRPEDNMTDEQFASLEAGIFRFLAIHPKGSAGVQVMGHRDLIAKTNAPNKKACPCFDVIPWWADVTSDAGDEDRAEDELDQGRTLVDQPVFWTVASGDSLSAITAATGVSLNDVLALNPDITNPNVIAVGQVIRLREV